MIVKMEASLGVPPVRACKSLGLGRDEHSTSRLSDVRCSH